MINDHFGKDDSYAESCLNNLSSSFRVAHSDPDKELRNVEAIDAIVNKSCDRQLRTKQALGTWSVVKNHELFSKEGNNIMVLHKLVNNIFIRWDKGFSGVKTLTSWNSDLDLL